MSATDLEGLRARVDEMRGALKVRNLRLVTRRTEMAAPVVEAQPVPGRAPFVIEVSGDDFKVTRRGPYAVITTAEGDTVRLSARPAKLAAIVLGVELAR